MRAQKNLYQEVVAVTADYLGPAAERFIDRQIEGHLGKPPEKLVKKDLMDLIDWISAAAAILTEDAQLRQEYAERLKRLSS